MGIIFILLPLSLLLALCGLGGYVWCVLKNQYRDIDGEAKRMLFEEPSSTKSGKLR